MVDPPELLQFLPGPWSRAHALEAGGTVRANTAWGDPAPTTLKGEWIRRASGSANHARRARQGDPRRVAIWVEGQSY